MKKGKYFLPAEAFGVVGHNPRGIGRKIFCVR